MADLADMLVASGLESSKDVPDIPGALMKGASLAMQKQKLELEQSKLAQQKLNMEVTKDTKILDTVKLLNTTKDPAMKKMLGNSLQNKVRMYGRENMYSPEYIKNLVNSNEMQAKLIGLEMQLTEQVQNGTMTQAEAHQQYQAAVGDPELLATMNTERFYEASKFSKSEAGKDRRAEMMAGVQFEKQRRDIEATGPKTQARLIEQNWAKFKNAGGLSGAMSKLRQVKEAYKEFKSGKVKTGGAGGVGKKLAGAIGVQGTIAPEYKAASDKLRASLNLKGSLDSQFSAKEAEQQYSMRTTDPTLPTEVNTQRAKAILEGSIADMKNSIEEFRRAGKDVSGAEEQLAELVSDLDDINTQAETPSSGGQTAAPAQPPSSQVKFRAKLKDPAAKKQMKTMIMADPSALKIFADRMGYDEETLKMILGME